MSILLNHVNYIYSPGTAYEKHALNDVSLKIEDGEMIGIIGHTGSGKSTLIQHMNGLLKATDGQILYNGQDIYDKDFDLRQLRFDVGLVFQYPEYQLFETTVLDDAMFGPVNKGIPKKEAGVMAMQALGLVGLEPEVYDQSPFDMSGGQKRRAAIAGVLAMAPKMLILDEPTAGLDPYGREEILKLIRTLHDENGMTVVIVSHSMEDMADYVDRMIVMNDGAVQYDGTPKEVFSHYADLDRMGLSVPQVTQVMQMLSAEGLPVPEDCITIEEAKNEIIKALRSVAG